MIPSRQQPKIARPLFWIFLLLLIATASATFGAIFGAITALIAPVEPEIISKALDSYNTFTGAPNRPEYRLSRPVNILVMGVDRVPEASSNSSQSFNGRSDTILLVRIDPTDQSINLLSIPRDTQVELPGIGQTKISEANAQGGQALTAKVLSNNLNNLPIERYVRVSTGAFRELVELLGGVDVFVPRPMNYIDNAQQLNINLLQGWQTLNGEQADQFARFRNDGLGDIGRIQRQQSLIQAIWKRLSSPVTLSRLPKIIRVMQKYVDTNLSFEEILTLGNFGLQLDRDNFKMVMLPGRSSSSEEDFRSYWILDPAGRDRVLSQFFKLGTPDFAFTGRSRSEYDPILPRDLKISIQNASSNPQAATRLAEYLANKGFDNISAAEDWPDRQRQTQIIVQRGDLVAASILKKALGGGKIEANSTGQIASDLTIRIGEDWAKR
ncbi:LCP family protein [Kamptonema sp. UHCC 0994]|uniref:LCP family protein n=1 Tax=Kamptonema sp. UHCC 0994 TaxID=3031329 RepID=UPI0023B970B4|nr:LCP family protein [Kamptonema sp. UHCC 0994]MDF0555446.1 LCP family protein [Kamptonema sp. UHCC 0994]